MGRHGKIESTLLHELTDNEARSQRAIKVIGYQHLVISNLEAELEQHRKKNSALLPDESEKYQEDYGQVQQELLELHMAILQLKEMQKEILREVEEEAKSKNYHLTKVTAGVDNDVSLHGHTQQLLKQCNFKPTVGADTDAVNQFFRNDEESQKLIDKFENYCTSAIRMQRNLNCVHENVKWLKKERDEVSSCLDEMTLWRKKVEGMLFDLYAGVPMSDDEEDATATASSGDRTYQHKKLMWRTARQFFTAEQAHFFLTG